MADANKELINKLQKDILQWEGYKPPPVGIHNLVGLGPVEAAFPNGVFPLGTVHELVCASSEQAAASGGLVTGIIAQLLQKGGVCVWIGRA